MGVDGVELRNFYVEGISGAHDVHAHAGKLQLIVLDDVGHRGDGGIERVAERGREVVDERLAAAGVAVLVGFAGGVDRRSCQERRACHVVGGHDAFDGDALVGDVGLELADVVEEAGVFQHEAATVLFDDEDLVVDEIVGLVGVQFCGSEVVDSDVAFSKVDFGVVGLLHGGFLSFEVERAAGFAFGALLASVWFEV